MQLAYTKSSPNLGYDSIINTVEKINSIALRDRTIDVVYIKILSSELEFSCFCGSVVLTLSKRRGSQEQFKY
ncbi:hypothetical protein BpHYR1_015067 [Brachionus plicatilis]|uniref:Uncharacterized protein n=1 Tax=Brachionus plicatilis TaxID=10195 RepID=A0A3M7SN64_BRAPC|nr:hypothetical protein BpHYR1_015067 [Brachionus plicatilis]